MAVDTDDPEAVAGEIRRRVRDATALACTVGIGQNKLQAKLATGFGKPGADGPRGVAPGVFRLTHKIWFAVLGDRPADALWGIGAKTAKRLAALGIDTVRQLAAAEPGLLAARLGPTIGPWLVRLAQGWDDSPVVGTPYVAHSHGRETTYQQDLADWAEVRREVANLARIVAGEIAEGSRPAARVVVKVRYAPFITHTHGQPLATPTVDAERIEQAALAALDRFTEHRPVRLLGVRAELVMPANPATGRAPHRR